MKIFMGNIFYLSVLLQKNKTRAFIHTLVNEQYKNNIY